MRTKYQQFHNFRRIEPRDLARFKALQCRESGSWLHAIPSPNIGTLLDNTSFQVCIGLRLGCNLCTPHICKCNAKVDEIGTHGLSCFKSSGRFSRHTEINSIINRSLTSIHVNSTLEPNGLSRDRLQFNIPNCRKSCEKNIFMLNEQLFLVTFFSICIFYFAELNSVFTV
jgi:hypothetical protein